MLKPEDSERLKVKLDQLVRCFSWAVPLEADERQDPRLIFGQINAFNISFELSWKLMRAYLLLHGITNNSPRETIKSAFGFGLLEADEGWLEILDQRNYLSHAYNEEMAKEASEKIESLYYMKIELFIKKMENIL